MLELTRVVVWRRWLGLGPLFFLFRRNLFPAYPVRVRSKVLVSLKSQSSTFSQPNPWHSLRESPHESRPIPRNRGVTPATMAPLNDQPRLQLVVLLKSSRDSSIRTEQFARVSLSDEPGDESGNGPGDEAGEGPDDESALEAEADYDLKTEDK